MKKLITVFFIVFISTSLSLSQDITPPTDIYEVRDGTGTDVDIKTIFLYEDGGSGYTISEIGDLSANWDISIDTESGIAKYWYAISSTTPGGTNLVGWTDVGISTAVTKTGLLLVEGNTYYFSVIAENGTGLQSNPMNSNGQYIEIRSIGSIVPFVVSEVRDGTGADIDSTTLLTELSANWTSSSDAESGISGYRYAIGTTVGGNNIVDWTNNGNNTSVTKTGLSLIVGTTYYFTVKAVNGIGLESQATNSDGILVERIIKPVTEIKPYPNPFVPGQGEIMKFTGLPTATSLKIYTISGKLVYESDEVSEIGELTWEGLNKNSNTVKPGLYICVLKDNKGIKKTGKIVIK